MSPLLTLCRIKISLGYCVSDYFAQGMTMGSKNPFFIFLNLARGDHMLQGPSIRVAISRPTTIDDFHLPSPLFKDYQSGCPDTLTRSEVRKKWIKALMPSNTLLAELNRFDQLAEQTISNHRVLYKHISDRLSLHPPSHLRNGL